MSCRVSVSHWTLVQVQQLFRCWLLPCPAHPAYTVMRAMSCLGRGVTSDRSLNDEAFTSPTSSLVVCHVYPVRYCCAYCPAHCAVADRTDPRRPTVIARPNNSDRLTTNERTTGKHRPTINTTLYTDPAARPQWTRTRIPRAAFPPPPHSTAASWVPGSLQTGPIEQFTSERATDRNRPPPHWESRGPS